MSNVRTGLVCLTTAIVAWTSGCKKSEQSSAPTPNSAAAPSPPPSASATATSVGKPTQLSAADQARYDALFPKCKTDDVVACETICNELDGEVCTYLASQMLAKKVPDDPGKRAKLNDTGCAKGALKSCSQLGTAYKDGDGVPTDIKKAVELYAKACDRGYGGGCNRLGNMYKKGDGVPADVNKAIGFYEKTCAAKEALGCYQLATLYGYGDLVPQDIEKAKTFSDKACELGYKDCAPPIGEGANATWPIDAKLEDVIIDPKKWDGQLVQLRGVAAYRGSPTSGYIFAEGGNPMTDGVPTMMDEGASPDVKKDWMKMPSTRDGVPVKKVMVRVQATVVPGKARFFIIDALEFYGSAGK